MKLNTTAFTTAYSANIESRVHALQFVFSKAKGSSTTAMDLITALSTATIKVTKNTAKGSENTIDKQLIVDLMEASISEGGAIRADIVGTTMVVKGLIVLSSLGAEHLSNNDYYKVQIESLASGISGDIYVWDANTDAHTRYEYSPVRLNGNTPKNINVGKTKFLCIPRENFEEIDLQYRTGQQVTYLNEEVEFLTGAGLPVALLIDGFVYPGGLNFYIIPVGQVTFAKLTYSDDASVILINEHPL